MLFRQVHNDVTLSVSIPQYADELFALTEKNRDFLKQWLPWLDTVTKPSDTKDFILVQLVRFQRGEALHVTIFYRDKTAGVLGYNRLDPANAIGHFGYGLGREYTG